MHTLRWHIKHPQWDPRGRAPGALYHHGASRTYWARRNTSVKLALQKLHLGYYSRVIVVNGGAKGLEGAAKTGLIDMFTKVLAPLAEKHNMLLVDGGTWDGIMEANGKARINAKGNYKLLGIAPGGAAKQEDGPKRDENMWPCLVEPAHSHLLLMGEEGWGSETEYMFKVVEEVTRAKPSVAVICNGGGITVNEALENIRQNRPLIVIKGSGRFADDLVEAMETGNVREDMIGADKIPQILKRKDLIRVVELGNLDHFRSELLGALRLTV